MEPPLPTFAGLTRLVAARAGGGSANRLSAAIAVAHDLAETGDALIERFVAEARADGLSWTQIGELFGTSKQAAQQRFGAPRAEPAGWPGSWSPAGRDVLVRAAEWARDLGHDHLGTEHVLLALLTGPDGPARRALTDAGAAPEVIRADISRELGRCEDAGDRSPAMMPRLRRALDDAQRVADRLGEDAAGPEHVLAGVLSGPDGLAVKLLARHGIRAVDARAALALRLGTNADQLSITRRRVRSSV